MWIPTEIGKKKKKRSTVIFVTLCVLVLHYKKHGNKFKVWLH